MAFGKRGLQQQVSRVGIVVQDPQHRGVVPLVSVSRNGAHFIQPVGDCHITHAGKVHLKNAFYDLRLMRYDHIPTVHHAVPQHRAVPRAARFKTLLDPPLHVFGNGSAFFLGERRQNRQHQLPFRADGVDPLFFKIHIHMQRLQLAHRLQQRDRVPGEPGNGLREKQVELSLAAIVQHTQKFVTVVFCSADALVGIHAAVQPIGMALDQPVVITDLR